MHHTPWGNALEKLRGKRSYRSMETAGIIRINQYKAILKSKLGPSVAVLDRWLRGMGYTWHDWARVYESSKRTPLPMAAESSPTYRVKVRGHPKKRAG